MGGDAATPLAAPRDRRLLLSRSTEQGAREAPSSALLPALAELCCHVADTISTKTKKTGSASQAARRYGGVVRARCKHIHQLCCCVRHGWKFVRSRSPSQQWKRRNATAPQSTRARYTDVTEQSNCTSLDATLRIKLRRLHRSAFLLTTDLPDYNKRETYLNQSQTYVGK